jgi:hypothetical protein
MCLLSCCSRMSFACCHVRCFPCHPHADPQCRVSSRVIRVCHACCFTCYSHIVHVLCRMCPLVVRTLSCFFACCPSAKSRVSAHRSDVSFARCSRGVALVVLHALRVLFRAVSCVVTCHSSVSCVPFSCVVCLAARRFCE